MDALTHTMLLAPISSLATWAACRWTYRRKLNACALQITHLRGDRRQLDEHLEEAKEQIGALKITLAAQAPKAGSKPAVATTGAKPDPVRPRMASPSYLDIPAGDASEGPWLPVHGFADTQPFEHSGA